MKKIVFLGILIFIVSVGVGYIYSDFFVGNNNLQKVEFEVNEIEEYSEINMVDLKTMEVVSEEEKVSPNTQFAIKEYYDECGHFKFEYAELPRELINLNKQEINEFYKSEYEVEELKDNLLIITKEINGICDNHFLLKLNNDNIEIYKLNLDGSYELYQKTEITKEYLTAEDIQKLEEGIIIYGEGKINAYLEDFE